MAIWEMAIVHRISDLSENFLTMRKRTTILALIIPITIAWYSRTLVRVINPTDGQVAMSYPGLIA